MRRLYTLSETIIFPLQILYVACLVLAVTGFLYNPNVLLFISTQNKLVLTVLDMLRNLASIILQIFPLLFVLRGIYRRQDDGLVVISGLLSYITFHIGMMFFQSRSYGPEVYQAILGIQISGSALKSMSVGTLMPYQTGLISAMLVLVLVRFFIKRMNSRSPYSLLGLLDKNFHLLIVSSTTALLIGIASAFIWPLGIEVVQAIFRFIAQDLNNPINLFIYGLLSRVLNVSFFSHWMESQFWFTSLGGTWVDALGAVHYGDVGMWTAQMFHNSYGLSTGRLITPLYILNIFAVPALLLAAQTIYTDKVVKRRMQGFVIMGVICSIFFGTLLPIEIFLLFTSPLLFIFHLIFTALLYAVLPMLSVTIGYAYSGPIHLSTPGSIVDLLMLIRNPIFQRSLGILLFIGLMTFLFYYAVTTYYYHKGAISFINPKEKEVVLDEVIKSMGGIDNIRLINASIKILTVQVHDRSKVNFEHLKHRASKVVERRAGYAISYGASSYMIYSEIQEQIEAYEASLLETILDDDEE